nr:MopE-related protein [uncultured Allomuricauda sp.]
MKSIYIKNRCHTNSKKFSILFFSAFFLLNLHLIFSQIPGQSYFDDTGYIEYIAGNYPLIISVPHGGDMSPDIIPDRVCVDLNDDDFDDDFNVPCGSIITLNDSFTQEIGRSITTYFHEQTGFYPHVVINRLRRRKLDTNRSKEQKPYQNEGGETEEAWDSYQNFIEMAKTKIVQVFGRGLLIDLHGHAHEIKRIELGYILTHSDLNQSDETLNTPFHINRNSTKNLINDNALNLEHSELVRGPMSFGALIHNKGYPAVPSPADLFPNFDEPYFNGGYNVLMHGAHFNDNFDAFQIECDQDIRINGGEPAREQFAELCATAINEYISLHYGLGVIDFDGDGAFSDIDCDDNNASVNPNAEEIPYNGIDDDCNPDTLDDDLDGDGFANANDCDDNDASIKPNAEEIPYNGIDDDCNPDTPDDDLDGDGFANANDCDDNDASIKPNAEEIPYNGIDDDCNPDTPDDDIDGDGFANANDCDDTNTAVNPNAEEIPYNGIDDDCNPNTTDDDLDGDGFANANDCNDNDASINPNAEEIPYNGIDDDCNPDTPDDDLDSDGFANANDCDDNDASIKPNAEEIPYNGIDDDCNPDTPDDDLDGDGFANANDCDDNDASIKPNAEEIPYNGIDDDCNPNTTDDDLDGDGFANANDCNDNNASINPNAEEIPYNGIDDDCNANTPDDDLDGDGFANANDCNDNDASINPSGEEIPNNGVDDHCNPETSDTVSDEITIPSEEELEEVNNSFIVYPNPANEELNINLPQKIQSYRIRLFDQNGRLVLEVKNQNVLKVAHLSQGTYILIFQNLTTNKPIIKNLLIVR